MLNHTYLTSYLPWGDRWMSSELPSLPRPVGNLSYRSLHPWMRYYFWNLWLFRFMVCRQYEHWNHLKHFRRCFVQPFKGFAWILTTLTINSICCMLNVVRRSVCSHFRVSLNFILGFNFIFGSEFVYEIVSICTISFFSDWFPVSFWEDSRHFLWWCLCFLRVVQCVRAVNQDRNL